MRIPFNTATLELRAAKPGRVEVVCLSIALAFLVGCGQKDSAKGAPGTPPGGMPVQVQVVKSATIPDTTEYLSVMKSRHSANINPQVEGQITKIFVKSGDRVNVGRPLLQIDPLKQQATVSGQEAARAAQEANVQLATKVVGGTGQHAESRTALLRGEFPSGRNCRRHTGARGRPCWGDHVADDGG